MGERRRIHLITSHHALPLLVRRPGADPDLSRWNGQSLPSGQLAHAYGVTDLDGTRPDCWRYMVEVIEAGASSDDSGYR